MKWDLFDGHCDTVSRCWQENTGLAHNAGNLDLERAGGFRRYGQFFAPFGELSPAHPEQLARAFDAQYALFAREMEANADRIVLCRTGQEADAAFADGRRAAFLSVEGAELLGCSLEGLDRAYQLGVRAVNLTWNHANALSGSVMEEPERGLSELGRRFVRRMQEYGMLVDVSHLSDAGFWDVVELSEEAGVPFFASHSDARAVYPHPRSLTDEMFRAVARCGGTVGINLYRPLLAGPEEPVNVDTVLAHMEHFLSLGGERTLALGCDFDGCHDLLPDGLDGIGQLERLCDGMLRRGFPEPLARGILFENLKRVVSEVCIISAHEAEENAARRHRPSSRGLHPTEGC